MLCLSFLHSCLTSLYFLELKHKYLVIKLMAEEQIRISHTRLSHFEFLQSRFFWRWPPIVTV